MVLVRPPGLPKCAFAADVDASLLEGQDFQLEMLEVSADGIAIITPCPNSKGSQMPARPAPIGVVLQDCSNAGLCLRGVLEYCPPIQANADMEGLGNSATFCLPAHLFWRAALSLDLLQAPA